MKGGAIPTVREIIDDDEIHAAIDVVLSDWLTTGPVENRFRLAFGGLVDAARSVWRLRTKPKC